MPPVPQSGDTDVSGGSWGGYQVPEGTWIGDDSGASVDALQNWKVVKSRESGSEDSRADIAVHGLVSRRKIPNCFNRGHPGDNTMETRINHETGGVGQQGSPFLQPFNAPEMSNTAVHHTFSAMNGPPATNGATSFAGGQGHNNGIGGAAPMGTRSLPNGAPVRHRSPFGEGASVPTSVTDHSSLLMPSTLMLESQSQAQEMGSATNGVVSVMGPGMMPIPGQGQGPGLVQGHTQLSRQVRPGDQGDRGVMAPWSGSDETMSMALASIPHGASALPAAAVPTVLERFPGFVRCVMDIAPEVVGWVIGRSGAHIKEMKHRSGCGMWVDQKDLKLYITGADMPRIHAAARLVADLISKAPVNVNSAGVEDEVTSHMIECPPHLIGLLIGRGGSTIKRIKEESRANVVINQKMMKVIVSGIPQSVRLGVAMIEDVITFGRSAEHMVGGGILGAGNGGHPGMAGGGHQHHALGDFQVNGVSIAGMGGMGDVDDGGVRYGVQVPRWNGTLPSQSQQVPPPGQVQGSPFESPFPPPNGVARGGGMYEVGGNEVQQMGSVHLATTQQPPPPYGTGNISRRWHSAQNLVPHGSQKTSQSSSPPARSQLSNQAAAAAATSVGGGDRSGVVEGEQGGAGDLDWSVFSNSMFNIVSDVGDGGVPVGEAQAYSNGNVVLNESNPLHETGVIDMVSRPEGSTAAGLSGSDGGDNGGGGTSVGTVGRASSTGDLETIAGSNRAAGSAGSMSVLNNRLTRVALDDRPGRSVSEVQSLGQATRYRERSGSPVGQPQSLGEFLGGMGLDTYTKLLTENEIDLEAIGLMADSDFQDIGIPKGPRLKLLYALRTGRNPPQAPGAGMGGVKDASGGVVAGGGGSHSMVEAFLNSLGLGRYSQVFQEAEIDMSAVEIMEESDYAQLGVAKGPRLKIMNELAKLAIGNSMAGTPHGSPATVPASTNKMSSGGSSVRGSGMSSSSSSPALQPVEEELQLALSSSAPPAMIPPTHAENGNGSSVLATSAGSPLISSPSVSGDAVLPSSGIKGDHEEAEGSGRQHQLPTGVATPGAVGSLPTSGMWQPELAPGSPLPFSASLQQSQPIDTPPHELWEGGAGGRDAGSGGDPQNNTGSSGASTGSV